MKCVKLFICVIIVFWLLGYVETMAITKRDLEDAKAKDQAQVETLHDINIETQLVKRPLPRQVMFTSWLTTETIPKSNRFQLLESPKLREDDSPLNLIHVSVIFIVLVAHIYFQERIEYGVFQAYSKCTYYKRLMIANLIVSFLLVWIVIFLTMLLIYNPYNECSIEQ
ncbi:uncharacterized protein LOC109604361 [Aethina tumida]|uniref:uncharacterized protein LOC109604361 n=1 Tax=Aethina tumida TaxID=116153 RepID=UPI002148E74F|nr:uncharacterized protein LOC109604361 [Aethina tumida]